MNWILDADISSFVDEIDHDWMQKFLEHRFADWRMLGLIRKWHKAGWIEFGRFAATARKWRGQSKPETFDFLGSTHCCRTGGQGRFQAARLTVNKRMRATLEGIRVELMRRSQRHHLPWHRFCRLADRFIPTVRNMHPYPEESFYASHS